jgi:hypothetical protein
MEPFGSFQALGIEGGTLLMFAMLLGLLVTGMPLAYRDAAGGADLRIGLVRADRRCR